MWRFVRLVVGEWVHWAFIVLCVIVFTIADYIYWTLYADYWYRLLRIFYYPTKEFIGIRWRRLLQR